MEAEHSTALQQTTGSPTYPGVIPPHPEQFHAQHPNLTEVTVKPLDLGLTMTPEATMEVEPSPTMQEIQAQSLEPPKEAVVQPPLYQAAAVPNPGLDQAQYPNIAQHHSSAFQHRTSYNFRTYDRD
ncbi:Leucine-rich repeat-containing protein 37A2 [Camelus dromedarius]|uniref:Leucine-rich repeat-containing protein 37A2 n=1 Tax=Camelus dromedarius TaxID=9838 RepID=A0A5N4DD43_CAMDR|nr:Leucine-rich repeat-containing protein 37A2 [Camelus dromedarius]